MNSHDQWGLDLGRKLAGTILPEPRVSGDVSSRESSTDGPFNVIKRRQEGSGFAGG